MMFSELFSCGFLSDPYKIQPYRTAAAVVGSKATVLFLEPRNVISNNVAFCMNRLRLLLS